MKKILYVASKVKLHINLFHTPFFKKLNEDGYEVHVCASNDYANKDECVIPWCDVFHEVHFHRIPIHPRNVAAYFKLRRIINKEGYDIIHCHTPIGGALTRIAARRVRKNGCRVIYTAHGFHFYKGAPPLNWIIFYTAERLLARFTDIIITINQEDYIRAVKFKKCEVVKMNGVGIDVSEFSKKNDIDRLKIRRDIGIPADSCVLIFAGEMSYRKHQDFLIKVLKRIDNDLNIHLILAGEGGYLEKYKLKAVEAGVEKRVHFLGFRSDINRLMYASDIYVSASRQEGLPVNIMEAMASGLPIVCFDIRGNNDLVLDGLGGMLITLDDTEEFAAQIVELSTNEKKRRSIIEFNRVRVLAYEREMILQETMDIYRKILEEGN